MLNQVKKPEISKVEELLKDPSKVVVVQTAPAVRVSLGELFNKTPGTKVTGKMVTALKKLGFKAVFDTDFGADVTIWEEANEFLNKVKNNGPFPMFNSCCIGWLQMANRAYQDLMPLVSTTKSPIGCLGSIIKTYYASKINVDPKNIVVVAVVPCVLKKMENILPYNKTNGIFDVDFCWTTKDLGQEIKDAGIDFDSLEDSDFDSPLGESTGGGTIFGRGGGVLEAALRNAIYTETGKIETDSFNFKPAAFSNDVLEADVKIGDKNLKVCYCGMMGLRLIADQVRKGTCPYHFVEVMACPGGCILGGGQPVHLPKEMPAAEVKRLRKEGLNNIDKSQANRVPALNKSLQEVYKAIYDGKPGSEKAEKALHRDYSIKA